MISENSLRQISHIFCGDTDGLYSYKSGPKLVSFFNQHFQANDQYAQGFPSRWLYVYDKLVLLLNSKKFDSFLDLILFEIASFSSIPDRFLKSLSAKYLSFISFGVPISPLVKPGETTGSANSHIFP